MFENQSKEMMFQQHWNYANINSLKMSEYLKFILHAMLLMLPDVL